MKLKLIAVTQLTQSSNSILRLVAIIFSFLNVADLVYPSYFEEDITYLGSGILRMQIISNDIVEIKRTLCVIKQFRPQIIFWVPSFQNKPSKMCFCFIIFPEFKVQFTVFEAFSGCNKFIF